MPSAFAELPAYRVAVLQSESESLHNPTLDVIGVLGDRARWRYELFTERTFDALLRAQGEFDCVVLGYNVIHRNERIAPLLADARVGLLMLHQLRLPDDFRLGPELGVSVHQLERAGEGQRTAIAPQRDPDVEILLNWPERVDAAALEARVACVLEPAADTTWRPVLVLDDGRPVLLRSPLTRAPRTVACAALLEAGQESHGALLRNLMAYCAGGPPGAVVLSAGAPPWRGTLVRKLRLRGLNAVELGPDVALDFNRWPLRAVSDVIVPRGQAEIEGQAAWLARGGRLTGVDRETGELHLRYRSPDARWVARRWSAWVQAGGADDRLRSVTTARAYLRTLAALEAALGADLARLGLRPLADHAKEVRRLAEKRLGDRDSLEGTIGATAALVEIGELVPGAIEPGRLKRVRKWLRHAAATAGAEDRVEIARTLGDAKMLAKAVGELRRPYSASAVARVRRAAEACETSECDIVVGPEDRGTILAQVTNSLLVAAEYLTALAGTGSAAAPDDGVLVDAAIATLTKHGTLTSGEPGGSTAEEVCAEALAVVAFLGLDDVATSELVKTESVPPAPFVEDALREGLEIREANARVRAENADLTSRVAERDRALGLARNLLGAVVVVVATILAGLATWLVADRLTGGLEFAADFVAPLTVWVVAVGVLGYPLNRRDLCPNWLRTLGGVLADGADGVKSFALGALGRPPGAEPPT